MYADVTSKQLLNPEIHLRSKYWCVFYWCVKFILWAKTGKSCDRTHVWSCSLLMDFVLTSELESHSSVSIGSVTQTPWEQLEWAGDDNNNLTIISKCNLYSEWHKATWRRWRKSKQSSTGWRGLFWSMLTLGESVTLGFWREPSWGGGLPGVGLHLPAQRRLYPETRRHSERRRWNPTAAHTLWPVINRLLHLSK